MSALYKKISEQLAEYVPEGTAERLSEVLVNHKVILTISRPRKTRFGDYKPHANRVNHYISINVDLNKYSFLVTLLHELAHMFTFKTYGTSVQAHGLEWKSYFKQITDPYIKEGIFPQDISAALQNYLINPKASSCSDKTLYKVLRNYDDNQEDGTCYMDELLPNETFLFDKRLFRVIERLRTRYKCVELKTGRNFVFQPTSRIKPYKI